MRARPAAGDHATGLLVASNTKLKPHPARINIINTTPIDCIVLSGMEGITREVYPPNNCHCLLLATKLDEVQKKMKFVRRMAARVASTSILGARGY